ncbi:MAG: ABC transporter ATP-binding protein [Acidimicrobiales bacterium]
MTALLDVSGVEAGYGEFQALFGIDLHVDEGEALAVIGANGAGKSTLMKAIAGELSTRGGEIRFDGHRLDHQSTPARVALGISLVPEGRRVFPSLTVEENLRVGGYRKRSGPWTLATVLDAFPLLRRLLKRPADRLSGGEQQALAIGRALMANARLLLLDEVSLGLAPAVVNQLYAALPEIRATGTTIMLVEQDTTRALAHADRVCCLLGGRVALTGTPAELSREQITQAYFGIGVPA